jgi:CHASE3 domain sensor protein
MPGVRRLLSRQTDTIQRSIASESALSGNPRDVREAMAYLDGAGLSSELRAAILQMETEERGFLRQRMHWQEESAGLSRMLFALVSVFSLVLIIIGGWRMSGDQTKRRLLDLTQKTTSTGE